MKNIYLKTILLCSVFVFFSCELEDIANPNAPTVESFSEGASQADVQLLSVGLEAVIRNDLEFHYNTVSYLAREYYDLSGTDPRYTGEVLKGPLDNNGFLTTRSYAAWYRAVKAANVMITAVENSSAGFSDQVKNSYYGFAKTLKAYSLLMVANRQYTNGIRVDVSDPDNLGPFVTYPEALVAIDNLLNEANTNLSNASATFDFPLSSGYAGFDTPSTFSRFNRAIAARVALYQGDKAKVLTLLNNSFFDLAGALKAGPSHVFGATGNDILNNQFHVLGQSGQEFVIHNSWINDAEAGDTRVTDKAFLLSSPATFDGLTGTHQIAIYKSNTDPVYLIRNEELILMFAEANIGTNNATALNAINVIRNAAGLASLVSPADIDVNDDNALLEEVLKQRRYSLLGEGHRWVDLRRLNRLNATYVPLDRAGDNIINAFPTPFNENAN
ncbi:RagB/SusD family nutrient uptake outer membrane protein [Tenacibaculum aiptasiae]|uniref:RagB/SusD family nutrient uptake outer membrane protein n=1 Tax=Tenacibaculum aiptasiae TaxID=426481 RepID=A0A7J5AMU9_9FLAO|nr:RagB/SusD family nutrient uptake outer membrane protein [Tenacibaculum aiptasiae]KAB1158840.1 RagB/SusD family nutrient uptake outer membrane protein [Tenacibaculum aiptasiae]